MTVTPATPNVLVTGGTSGIGRACVLAFLAEGARVFATWNSDRDAADRLEEVAGDRLHLIRADATDAAQVLDAVREASAGGCPDVLVNNVGGVLRRAPALELDPDTWNQVLALNLGSTYLFTRAVLPGMTERGSGSIVNISALSAGNGGAGSGSIAYAAAKAGVETMTVGLARELAPAGIRVNAVRAGIVDTPLHGRTEFAPQYGNPADFVARSAAATPAGRAAGPGEIAECVRFLASPAASYVTGAILSATGGA